MIKVVLFSEEEKSCIFLLSIILFSPYVPTYGEKGMIDNKTGIMKSFSYYRICKAVGKSQSFHICTMEVCNAQR